MTLAFVFPGQGSQKIGMMQNYGASSIIRDTFEEASTILNKNLWELAEHGPAEALAKTVNTQPLMLAADIAVWRLWQELGGNTPDVLAGHSLGEYAALVAADVIDFTDAVSLVHLRASAMQEAVPEGIGAMAAILGLDAQQVHDACAQSAQGEEVAPVNFNDPMQTVIAGHKMAVDRALEACKSRGARRALLLPVSAPFHSKLMEPAAKALAAHLKNMTLRMPKIPLINNVDAAITNDPEEIGNALIRQAYHPVRWVETVEKIESMGITTVLECGPGNVLTGLNKRCVKALNSISLSDLDTIQANLSP